MSATRHGGSGVVVDGDRGLVLTNAHVTAGPQGMRARVGDDPSSETAARLVAAAPCDDLAVVQLVNKPANLQAIQFGDSATVQPGDHVTVLGYPISLEQRSDQENSDQAQHMNAVDGNVSAVDVVVDGGAELPRYASMIQHQAPTNPGNSGGPLVDDQGQLVAELQDVCDLVLAKDPGQAVRVSGYTLTSAAEPQDLYRQWDEIAIP